MSMTRLSTGRGASGRKVLSTTRGTEEQMSREALDASVLRDPGEQFLFGSHRRRRRRRHRLHGRRRHRHARRHHLALSTSVGTRTQTSGREPPKGQHLRLPYPRSPSISPQLETRRYMLQLYAAG